MMSADMQKRNTLLVVPPQSITDRSIIESVTDFITDVTQSNAHQTDQKTQILWVRFETCHHTIGNEEVLSNSILLVLGYSNGIQVWAIPANGEAVEVLSWRHGLIKCLKILPPPLIESVKEQIDQYFYKRPLIVICEAGSNPQLQYFSVNFISLKDGDQIKNIKFKNPVVDIYANKTSVVITFSEKIAVFDLLTLEDRLTITTCQISPGISSNPIALGSRWIAFSEKSLHLNKKSGGGYSGEGEVSYTASMLNAAKTLGKSLKDLGGQVAAGLTGGTTNSMAFSPSNNVAENLQYGVITVYDIKNPIKDITSGNPVSINGSDPVVAHFVAHKDPIVALAFDFSGMLLFTADKKGHNFHIFRIYPHPITSTLAAVHHLYTLHRGDTTAKVQDVVFSLDSRYVSVLTTRGTTHLFAITPYGGEIGLRTHAQHHVVNKLSRFHRSAGILISDGRSNSPVNFSEQTIPYQTAYANPRLPPYTSPIVLVPLAQIRQTGCTISGSSNSSITKTTVSRQRNYSSSEQETNHLKVAAIFGQDRSYLLNNLPLRDMTKRRKAADCLFIMTSNGQLIQYDIDTKPASTIPKEKISDESPFELQVEAKAQWILLRNENLPDVSPPLAGNNPLLNEFDKVNRNIHFDENDDTKGDKWLSQVEIITHSGPHRRLWMGPQFQFKTYSIPSGGSLSSLDEHSVEIGTVSIPINKSSRSGSINIPEKSLSIESGSSSTEQSPRLSDAFHLEHHESNHVHFVQGETQIKEDLADAMRESPAVVNDIHGGDSSSNNSSCYSSTQNLASFRGPLKIVNPLGTVTTINDDLEIYPNQTFNELHENSDETLFRPVVTVINDEKKSYTDNCSTNNKEISNLRILRNAKLIVPIIDQFDISKNNPIVQCHKNKSAIGIVKENNLKKMQPFEKKIIDQNNMKSSDGSDIAFNLNSNILHVNGQTFDELTQTQDISQQSKNSTIIDDNIEEHLSLDLQFPSLEPLENFKEDGHPSGCESSKKDSFWNTVSQNKLIFAMCTSLKEEKNDYFESEPHESQDSDYKSLETEENAKVFSEFPRSDDTTSSGSDDNTEENPGVLKAQEDDEELRPLIKNNDKYDNDEAPSLEVSNNINVTDGVHYPPNHLTTNKKKSRRKRK
uniref:CSON013755 protein n=1 Tax=Culicoides sonorensis TaxID=179676 RepID=A0A336M9H6_CULSO